MRLLTLSLALFFHSSFGHDVIQLHVPEGAKEGHWRDALAAKINGKTEYKVERGSVDILTESHAIEVDWLGKYDEGYGQALRYSVQTGKTPTVALIVPNLDANNLEKIEFIENTWNRLCNPVELWILERK